MSTPVAVAPSIDEKQWLVAWPRLYATLPPAPPPLPSMGLLLLLRGEAYRNGNQHSRMSTSSSAATTRVIHSFRSKLLDPATAQGWKCATLADIYVPEPHRNHFRQTAQSSLGLVAFRSRPINSTQLKSVVSTLRWAIEPTQAELIVQTIGDWRALLLIRVDLELKSVLELPLPVWPGCDLIVPFQVRCVGSVGTASESPSIFPRPSDCHAMLCAIRLTGRHSTVMAWQTQLFMCHSVASHSSCKCSPAERHVFSSRHRIDVLAI